MLLAYATSGDQKQRSMSSLAAVIHRYILYIIADDLEYRYGKQKYHQIDRQAAGVL